MVGGDSNGQRITEIQVDLVEPMTTGSLRDLRAAGVARVDERLAERGLNRRRADEYAWPLASGFDGWLGLRYISDLPRR